MRHENGYFVDGLSSGPVAVNVNYNNYNNRRLDVNADNEPGNDARMTLAYILGFNGNLMETYTNLYSQLCSYENLELAYIKARKRKSLKHYVIEFEAELDNNLKQLKMELETFTYLPSPLTTFIVRDPKTRTISSSHFRDRVVHHALCNIVAPILEKNFIHDSFANRKGKGTHMAIKRFENFSRKVVGGGAR